MAAEDPKIVRLINKAKKGEKKAFDTLMKMVEGDLKKLANHYFIIGSDREDVMQELRLGVFKAVNSFDCTKADRPGFTCINFLSKNQSRQCSGWNGLFVCI